MEGMMAEERAAQAERTIARQAAEIAELRHLIADSRLAAELRATLGVAATLHTIDRPSGQDRLLELIVATAMRVMGARAGALFLLDEAAGELLFAVALGGQAREVKALRVPLGHGIAGLVAATGQPLAVSDAGSDPRQAADIAERVGYRPDSILCVPLVHDDRVIGVIELLDKEVGGAFTLADMATLGLFANQAAITIAQASGRDSTAALLVDLLRSSGAFAGGYGDDLLDRVGVLATRLGAEDTTWRQSVELAGRIWAIASRDDASFRTCRMVLDAFVSYAAGRTTDAREAVSR
jgi:GAF domain-containing protein